MKEKLRVLAAAAKYDVSCSSSGASRKNRGKGLGNSFAAGICHSYTPDGRCISLLKILFTNHCIYDCAYCINRRSNEVKRVAFTVQEVVDLTINFYRRNYIEGLFLSSGVLKNPDYTMERMAQVAQHLREKHNFYGYIHLKSIPGASPELLRKAGRYADRLSVNIEIPSETHLKRLAPEKNFASVFQPMGFIRNQIAAGKEERKKFRNALPFSPAGQSTQLIIGASPEKDLQILSLAHLLYSKQQLKRVYYSGYLPVNTTDTRLPALHTPPLVRENRLYQADWLLRFYNFSLSEIVNERYPELDLEFDPKLSYALRNYHLFPIDVNRADYEMILRVPGIGVKSANRIVAARRHGTLNSQHLKKMGVVMKRAKFFITCRELMPYYKSLRPELIRRELLKGEKRHKKLLPNGQLDLFASTGFSNALACSHP